MKPTQSVEYTNQRRYVFSPKQQLGQHFTSAESWAKNSEITGRWRAGVSRNSHIHTRLVSSETRSAVTHTCCIWEQCRCVTWQILGATAAGATSFGRQSAGVIIIIAFKVFLVLVVFVVGVTIADPSFKVCTSVSI